jgi:hypothetical protein
MSGVINGDYIKEVTARVNAAREADAITIEEGKAEILRAIREGRPDVDAVSTPGLTYERLRKYVWENSDIRAKKMPEGIIYGIKGIGGIERVKMMFCTTSYRNSQIVQPSESVRKGVIARCTAITDEYMAALNTDPADIKLPDDLKDKITDVEWRIMGRGGIADAKLYLLEGRAAWIDALIKSGDYKAYKTLDELKFELKSLSSALRTSLLYYRQLDQFLMYIESKNIDIRYFKPFDLDNFKQTIAMNYWDYVEDEYKKKKQYYDENPKIYKAEVSSRMRKKGISREEAEATTPAPPKVMGAGTLMNYSRYIVGFFNWLILLGRFPRIPGSDKIESPLKSVEVPTVAGKKIPYILSIDSKKDLMIGSSEITQIYRAILKSGLPEEYLRRIFILLRIIRESGARPANVIWLRWCDFKDLKPRVIDWTYAGKKAIKGKRAPETTYISFHLAEDVDAYRRKYKPDDEEFIAGGAVFPKTETVLAEDGYLQIDEYLLSEHIRRLGRFIPGTPVAPIKFRKSLASLVWVCLGSDKLVKEFTGDLAKTVNDHYKEVGRYYVQVAPEVQEKFHPAEIARQVFDKEYPITGIPAKYKKRIPDS